MYNIAALQKQLGKTIVNEAFLASNNKMFGVIHNTPSLNIIQHITRKLIHEHKRFLERVSTLLLS